MNAGQSAEEPFAPKRGETKIALKLSPTAPRLWKIFVADGTSTKLSCAFEGGSTEATAILEGQAERPAAGLNHGFLSLFARFFLSFALHRRCIRDLHFEPIGGRARNGGAESFINTTLSKLEHNSDRRPTADAKKWT